MSSHLSAAARKSDPAVTTPIVTEVPRALEGVTRDPFIEHLLDAPRPPSDPPAIGPATSRHLARFARPRG
jgi:hypothetical protein